ncbi:hypothetical protein ACN28C_22880 [Plantactinospora sp. WMMC1484]|uniref:hypothetical protein n=1 Tax=Plantactinospora sp. WMMC1484 TaxID=3404122 RepID=UPI003BF5B531
MDWQRLLHGVADVAQGAAYGMVVGQWSQLDDNTAFNQIFQYVQSRSVAEVDAMDQTLLGMCVNTFDPTQRRRLTTFYATFKVAETLHFQQFRGFP